EHVFRGLDELRARLDERVAALGDRRVDRTRNGEDLATLLGGRARRDERAGSERRLDDQTALRESADQAIAAREVRRERACAEGELGGQQPALGDLAGERGIAARV